MPHEADHEHEEHEVFDPSPTTDPRVGVRVRALHERITTLAGDLSPQVHAEFWMCGWDPEDPRPRREAVEMAIHNLKILGGVVYRETAADAREVRTARAYQALAGTLRVDLRRAEEAASRPTPTGPEDFETTPEPNPPYWAALAAEPGGVTKDGVLDLMILVPRGRKYVSKPYSQCTRAELAAAARFYEGARPVRRKKSRRNK
jgi:hypothetical protein